MMERRRFLGLTAVGALAAAWPSAAWTGPWSSEQLVLAEPGLLNILGDRTAVRRLGDLYRRAYPVEDDAPVLRAAIGDGMSDAGPALCARIDRKIQNDFAAGRTVRLDGWVLARTEARQCALFSLTHR